MVKFSLEKDNAVAGSHKTPLPGKGGLGAARTQGGGTKYPAGDGPQGKGGGHQLGPNGTTGGPAGTRISGFHGSPKGYNCSASFEPRSHSNPMKR